MDSILRRTEKCRLYPTKAQQQKQMYTLDGCCVLYNAALEQRKTVWQHRRVSIKYKDQSAELPGLKEEVSELQGVHSQVLQDALRRLDKTFKGFFRRLAQWKNSKKRPLKGKRSGRRLTASRVKKGISNNRLAREVCPERSQRNNKPGYPRFKSKNRYHSFTYPQYGNGCKLIMGRGKKGILWLSGIGDIKIRLHRPLPEGAIKTVTIKREVDEWYACFTIEIPRPEPIAAKKAVGIDSNFKRERIFTVSDGRFVANPALYRTSERKLKHKQRSLSRKKKGSKNRKKQRLALARAHRKIARQRRDFLHKESRRIVNEYDVIKLEDMNLPELVQDNPFLAKAAYDSGLGIFRHMLVYKAEDAGKRVEWIPAEGTTDECSRCGMVVVKSAGAKYHRCPWCGLRIDQHLNAAINILGRDSPLWRGGTTRPAEAGSPSL